MRTISKEKKKNTMYKSESGRTYIDREELAYNVKLSDSPRRGRAIFPDGKVRSVQLGVPDTFSTIPARGKINGRTLSGFVSVAGNFLFDADLSPNPNAGEFEFTPRTR